MNEYEKVLAIKNHFRYTWKEMADTIGIASPQTFYDIKAEKIGISNRLADAILTAIPNINPNWLLGTNEDMFTSDERSVEIQKKLNEVNFGSFFKDADSAVVYEGSGMMEIPKGAMLALKRISVSDSLMPGRLYFVKTQAFADVRVVGRNSNEHQIVLHATDKSTYVSGGRIYADITINDFDIAEIFLVMGMVISQFNDNIMEVI